MRPDSARAAAEGRHDVWLPLCAGGICNQLQIYEFHVIISFYNEKCCYLTVKMVINAIVEINENGGR